MEKGVLVGVRLYNRDKTLSEKIYDYKNNCEFKINKNDRVVVKVGTGGTNEGIVEYVKEKDIDKSIKYKSIVEVVGLNTIQEELLKGNSYICDIRVFRRQWSSNDNTYKNDWSDLTIKCLYDINKTVSIGDIVIYEGEKAKIVNLRQLPVSKVAKLKYIDIEERKVSLLDKIIKKLIK